MLCDAIIDSRTENSQALIAAHSCRVAPHVIRTFGSLTPFLRKTIITYSPFTPSRNLQCGMGMTVRREDEIGHSFDESRRGKFIRCPIMLLMQKFRFGMKKRQFRQGMSV